MTQANFLSGEYLMMVAVGGMTLVSVTFDKLETKPLTEEITYREITDVLTSLSGKGEPGPPQITAAKLSDSPVLAGTAELTFPKGLNEQAVCPKVATVAESLGVRPRSGRACEFEPVRDDWRGHVEGYVERQFSVYIKDYPPEGNIFGSEELARDLQDRLRQGGRAGDESGQLYRLPFEKTGYAVYCGNILSSAFLLDNRTYVHIDFSCHRVQDSDLVALSENEVLDNLATILTAMSSG